MNREYAYSMEDKGYKLLEDFNEKLDIQGLSQTPRNYQVCDASGYTSIGNPINIEYKIRKMRLEGNHLVGDGYTADTIFIEDHKVGLLLLDYTINNRIPLYVNFLDNCIIVYNLSRLKKFPKMTAKQKIGSNLYESFELCKRIELPLEEAYIYYRDNNNQWKGKRIHKDDQ